MSPTSRENSEGITRRSAIGVTVLGLLSAVGCAPSVTSAMGRAFPSLVLPGQTPPPVVADVPEPLGCPKIYTRAYWGASPTKGNRDAMGKITRLTIHHSAMGLAEASPESEIKAEIQRIQHSHQGYRHWADIGYHYIIDYDGRVWEGRPLKYQGAHVGGAANRHNIGICLMGDYDIQKPSHAELESLRGLLNHLMATYKIPSSEIHTHREVAERYGMHKTHCPGDFLQAKVNVMRREIVSAEKLAK